MRRSPCPEVGREWQRLPAAPQGGRRGAHHGLISVHVQDVGASAAGVTASQGPGGHARAALVENGKTDESVAWPHCPLS